MKKFNLIPFLDASDFPMEVENELSSSEVSTHCSNDVLSIWDWNENRYPETQAWLIETYGEEVKQYKYFAIQST